MSKRKLDNFPADSFEPASRKSSKYDRKKKHTLDSDEEDTNDEADNIMDDAEFEGIF